MEKAQAAAASFSEGSLARMGGRCAETGRSGMWGRQRGRNKASRGRKKARLRGQRPKT